MKRDQDPGISRVTKARVWVALAAILLAVAVIAGGLVVFATDLNGQRLEAASWEYHTLQVKLAALDLRISTFAAALSCSALRSSALRGECIVSRRT